MHWIHERTKYKCSWQKWPWKIYRFFSSFKLRWKLYMRFLLKMIKIQNSSEMYETHISLNLTCGPFENSFFFHSFIFVFFFIGFLKRHAACTLCSQISLMLMLLLLLCYWNGSTSSWIETTGISKHFCFPFGHNLSFRCRGCITAVWRNTLVKKKIDICSN